MHRARFTRFGWGYAVMRSELWTLYIYITVSSSIREAWTLVWMWWQRYLLTLQVFLCIVCTIVTILGSWSSCDRTQITAVVSDQYPSCDSRFFKALCTKLLKSIWRAQVCHCNAAQSANKSPAYYYILQTQMLMERFIVDDFDFLVICPSLVDG